MEIKQVCMCENCGRSSEQVEIEQLSLRGHVATLCLTCTRILCQTTNEERFIQLVRKKNIKSSNIEMQKIHKTLSALIAVGTLFVVVIFAFGVVKNVETVASIFENVDSLKQKNEYLSFGFLNQFK